MVFEFFSSLLPFAVFLVSIFWWRFSLIKSVIISLASVPIVVGVSDSFSMGFGDVSKSFLIGSTISLNVILVVLPGLLFNAILKRQGVIDGIVRWFESWSVPVESKVLLMITGVLPIVESLTGFGVCLLVGVPLFLSLFGSHVASRLSMLGMNCMPWGVLALPTLVGADLCGVEASLLSSMSAWTSSLIFPYFSFLALWVCGGWCSIKRYWGLGLIMSSCYSVSVILVSLYGSFELSGVIGGLCVVVLFVCWSVFFRCLSGDGLGKVYFFKEGGSRLFIPYVILIVLASFVKVDLVNEWLVGRLSYDIHGVSLKILGNPGFVIIISCSIVYFLNPVRLPIGLVLKKSLSVTLVLFGFVLLSQLLSFSGMIGVPVSFLRELVGDKFEVFVLVSPVLGMFSGFLAGSNLGGNALMMNVQCQMGGLFEREIMFAAIQNSSAGHAVYTSLAIIVLILAIMKEATSSFDGGVDDSAMINNLMVFGFKVAIGVYLLIVLAVLVGNYWFGSFITAIS